MAISALLSGILSASKVAIAAAQAGTSGYGVIEGLKLQKKQAKLANELAERKMKLEEDIAALNIEMLEIQNETLKIESKINIEVLVAKKDLAKQELEIQKSIVDEELKQVKDNISQGNLKVAKQLGLKEHESTKTNYLIYLVPAFLVIYLIRD